MTASLARLQQALNQNLAVSAPIDEFRPLDKYAGGFSAEPARVPWLATISAGHKGPNGLPIASRKSDKEWIHMTAEDRERAPGLAEALEAGGWRWLDVAVASDDPDNFLQQHFEKRSATKLEAYGDERQIIEIAGTERRVHLAGSREYASLVRECSVSCSFFFTLARWEGRTPRIYFPASDGLGMYRLRFTSRNSLRELIASLRQVAGLTGGRLAGLPLRLSLDWREVADPQGVRRTVGVWRLRFMPPEQLELTPRLWRDLAQEAIAEGEMLRLPAPTLESLEDAERIVDVDLDVPTDAAVRALDVGPPCDAAFYQRAWFARVKGTSLDDGDARAQFINRISEGRTSSLSDYLATATEEQAARLIAAAGQAVGTVLDAEKTRRYNEIFGESEEEIDRRGQVVTHAGHQVDARTGEVLGAAPAAAVVQAEMVPEPTRAELWAENRRLIEQAQERGITGPTLNVRAGVDALRQANADLAERIRNYDLDQAAQRESEGSRTTPGKPLF